MANLTESKIIREFQEFDIEVKCGSTLLERREWHLYVSIDELHVITS